MKKTTGLLYLLAFSVFTIYSCGGGVGSDPKSVVIEFGKRMAKKDYEGAAKLTSEASKSMMDMMIAQMKKEKPDGDKDPMEEFDKAEFGEAKIDGDKATVPVKMKDEKNSVNFPLIKEKGAWKIHLTMESMMEMAKDQVPKVDAEDMEKGMDALKNMDPEQMKKAMDMGQDILNDPEKMKMVQELMKQYGDPAKAKELEEAMKNLTPEKIKEMQDMMKMMKDSMP